MPLPPFAASRALSLGVELELQLVSLSDHDLVSASPDMLMLLHDDPPPGQVVPEITQSMIEVSTGIHHEHGSLLLELQRIRDRLVAVGDRINVGVCGGGTHPFQQWSERRIFDKPRFLEVSALYGYLAKQFTVFGQHVHVGCASGDDALYLLHALSRYVPHFIALSASSPYVQRHDTLFQSSRLNAVNAFPLSGRAPFELSWQGFVDGYFASMERTGIVSSMKDFYWDIRPKPEYGTIELRVCDTPLSVDHAAALAAYLQCLCLHLLERREQLPRESDYLVYGYNRFQACRFGLDGVLVDPRDAMQRPLRNDIADTLARLRTDAHDLGAMAALDHLERVLAGPGDAQRLRDRARQAGCAEAIVDLALQQFRA
ncbi:YbdK family carboxylate-amine ligase [Ideonella alba]|uniref:Putative glutamate--cysteine ligase 2 n=1 Tax=Ideonella alba TaxID=2824118 RepID=A0A940YDR1_9BURK|nr:YbdK family carboxylate-amine ligase [Ideonella alba]MBQ0933246.1 glutamate--cysteine ligase [Ideonella alba]